jgi:histidyl-tRNA synthetase
MAQKPSIARGTRDFSPIEVTKRNYIFDIIKTAFQNFGFQPIETPSFENLSTLTGKYGEEGDNLIFKILNSGDKVKKADIKALEEGNLARFSNSLSEKALRYDLTVPFARYVVQHQNDITFPFKRYQIQPVWRADRPANGRFREFFQCDADVVGSKSLWQEVEFVQLYDKVFSSLGLEGVTIKINNRKILSGIAEVIGAKDKLIDFTVALDKLDKIGEQGVKDEMLNKGISAEAIEKVQPLFGFSGNLDEKLDQLKGLLSSSEQGMEGISDLEFVFEAIDILELQTATLDLDITLARGLNYYTGAIFEVSAPEGVKMGSIGGGGRYDDLTGIFGLKDVSGVGISFGLDRIYLVLEELNLFPKTVSDKVDVLCINFGEKEALASLKLIKVLRAAGRSAELYPDNAKMKKQMMYANKREIPYVILIGDNELVNNTCIVKNMKDGTQLEVPFDEVLTAF